MAADEVSPRAYAPILSSGTVFKGVWELKRALMCFLGGKIYTTFRSVRICALRGQRVNSNRV